MRCKYMQPRREGGIWGPICASDIPGERVGSPYNLAGTLDSLTLLDETVGTEQDDTDLAGLEVHAHTLDTGGEPEDR